MSDETILDHFDDVDDFVDTMNAAADGAKTVWESDFVDDMNDRYERYGLGTYLSHKQAETINRIAGK